MRGLKRTAPAVLAALGLVATGLLAGPSQAAQPEPTRSTAGSAVRPTCEWFVGGFLPSGRLVTRHVSNVRIIDEKKSAPLPYRVDDMETGGPSDKIENGRILHFQFFTKGQRTRGVDVRSLDTDDSLTVVKTTRYLNNIPGRLITASASYYRYAIDASGNLKRWTWSINDSDQLYFSSPTVIAKNQGNLKTLVTNGFIQRPDGVYYDVLYGTTRGGALKQYQIPLRKAGKLKITTVRSTGFATYDDVSPTWCNRAGTIAGFLYIDRGTNQARWWTLSSQYSPRSANLVRRALVAPGAEWRLHAAF